MSTYEWERGEFTIPSAEWAKFKTAIRDATNKMTAEAHELAVKLHAELKKPQPKATGGFKQSLENLAREKAYELAKAPSPYYPRRYDDEQIDMAVRSLFKWEPGKPMRLQTPKKASFPTFGNNVTAISGNECDIRFDNEKRKVFWSVSENNHACDRARESQIGKAFFAALDKVVWTRGSGGTIIGNDEYNRDAGHEYEGGGGSYSKGSWGPDSRKAVTSLGGAGRSHAGGGGFRY